MADRVRFGPQSAGAGGGVDTGQHVAIWDASAGTRAGCGIAAGLGRSVWCESDPVRHGATRAVIRPGGEHPDGENPAEAAGWGQGRTTENPAASPLVA